MNGAFKVVVLVFFLAVLSLTAFLFMPQKAYATVSVTAATGGTSISADTTGGSYTTLTGPTITEGANSDIGTGTIVFTVPSGFSFNTSGTVTALVVKDAGSSSCFSINSTATPTTTTITFTVSASDSKAKGGTTICHVTFSNIQVRPTSGTPLASSYITNTGTAAGVPGVPPPPTKATNYGTLTEVAGAKNKIAITTQPPATVVVSTDFSTHPVVALEDQFGNPETGDSSSTVSEAVVLSTQSCGGTSGTGTLTSTPSSGSSVTSGVMSYTAMQYSAAENIKICFSSSGVTSALSNAITVGIVSISITSSGVVSYGIVPVNTTKDTTATGLNNTQTAKNNGTILEDFNIQGQNSADWTLASSNGVNQYVHSFSTNGGSTWTPLTTSFQSLVASVAVNGTQNFDLKLTTPTSTSNYSQESVNVTILAVAH